MPNLSKSLITQRVLVQVLKTCFPNEEILEVQRKETKLRYPGINTHFLELDVWMPKFKLAFEFQDDYHFATSWYCNKESDVVKFNDNTKRELVEQSGVNLISVPIWWDGLATSLLDLIGFHRPDLVSQINKDGPAVPLNYREGFFKQHLVPDIGELMLASFSRDSDTTYAIADNSWWLGGKYDGVRFCWHPELSVLYTRNGIEIYQPSMKWEVLLPTSFIDGEIWAGRGQFLQVMSFYSSAEVGPDILSSLRFLCFDEPSKVSEDLSLESRYKFLLDYISPSNPLCIVVPRILASDGKHLRQFTQYVLNDRGEGTIIQKIGSVYLRGRSNELVKIKASQVDTEALVVGIDEEAIQLKLPNGIVFPVPMNSVQVYPLPRRGEIVSFACDVQYRFDKPVDPIITRIRTDMTWKDAVDSFSSELTFFKVNERSVHGSGFWSNNNMKTFMENLARSMGLDPSKADTWYSFTSTDIERQGGMKILRKLGGYQKALLHLFPEISFDPRRFPAPLQIAYQREFLEKFARDRGLDPHSANTWHSIPPRLLQNEMKSLSKRYYSSLRLLFPDIKWHKSKYFLKMVFTVEKSNRRRFLELFAQDNNFDPLIASNWRAYFQKLKSKQLLKNMGYYTALRLIRINFPETNISEKNIESTTRRRHDFKNKKHFFVKYANKNNLDPLSHETWYT